jgi:hypothetical protein
MDSTAYVRSTRIGGWRWAVVLLTAVVVASVGVLLAQRTALAHDHQIPNTVLKKGAKELQTGLLVVDSSWTQPAGNGEHVTQTASYSWRFPEADRVAADSKLRVRVLKSQKPDAFSITAYPKLDERGAPSGQGRLLRRSLKPVVQDGKTVAWDVVFYVARPARDYYLVSEGHWKDVQGSGADQWAHWSFHVKTRSS